MDLASFWAPQFWGNRFGQKGPFYSAVGHLGLDIIHPAGTPIPALRGGTARVLPWDPALGYRLAIEVGKGDWDAIAHAAKIPPNLHGRRITAGTIIGAVAGPGDRPGRLWKGAHTHLTHGSSILAASGIGVTDPAPYITAALRGLTTAGLGKTPIDQEEDMNATLYIPTGGSYKAKACLRLGTLLHLAIPGPEADYWKAHGVPTEKPSAVEFGYISSRLTVVPRKD